MNESIEIEIKYTAEDFARGAKFTQNRSFIVKYGIFILIFGFFALVLFLYFVNPTEFIEDPLSKILPFISALVILIPLFLFMKTRKSSFLVRKQIEKQIESSPALQESQLVTIDQDGLKGEHSFSQGSTKWEAFIEVTENEEYFFFFTSSNIAQFIPKRAFASENQQSQLRELIKRKLGEKSKLLNN